MRKIRLYIVISLLSLIQIVYPIQNCADCTSGYLDLSELKMINERYVKLDGEWEFYWNSLLEPSDFENGEAIEPTGYIKVPGVWNGYQINEQRLGGTGYATYRLVVSLPYENFFYTLSVSSMATAYRMWINGECILSNGIVGISKKTSQPQQKSKIKTVFVDTNRMELIVQVANYYSDKGGIWNSIRLGTEVGIKSHQEVYTIFFGIISGMILLFFVGNLIIYTITGNRFALYSFLLAIIIFAGYFLTGNSELILFQNWFFQVKISMFFLFMGIVLLTLLMEYTFKTISKPFFKNLGVFTGIILSILLIFLPVRVMGYLLYPFHFIVIIMFIYFIYLTITGIKERIEGSKIVLVGIIILMIGVINDILETYIIVQSGYILGVTGIIFLILSYIGGYLSTDVFKKVPQQDHPINIDELLLQLTKREMEVADLLSDGKKYADIAEDLCISEGTVKTHVFKIYDKLNVSNKTELSKLISRHKKK